ncbi:MAG: putative GNAT family N-acyltransferase [Shewanella psychromarinicola]|jgi:predicted GNAT family N-acyltransferase|uniref:GNAT family N-acetyltransferase n=1 Tax=Shewanella psychromarinicola TaxID=2487742 RepID=UPI003EEEB0C1
MYHSTWLDTKITANHQPSVATKSIAVNPRATNPTATNPSVTNTSATNSTTTNPTATNPTATNPTAIELTAIKHCASKLSAIKAWSAIKLFYRQHMPYARLAQKEAVAVIHHLHSSDTNSTDLNQQTIVAAIRIKPIGQYQLISGLLVHPHYRGQQLSSQLLQFIAPKLTSRHCFLFAHPWLIDLYQRQHFVVIEPSEFARLPAEIMQLYRRYHSEQRPLVIMQLNDPAQ